MVVAWQRSQRLVEEADEQMAVGADAVPPSVAATSLGQVVSSTLPQPGTGQRVSCFRHARRTPRTTPLSQRVDDSSSNSVVQWPSVFSRIHPSHPAAAQHDAVLRASGVVH